MTLSRGLSVILLLVAPTVTAANAQGIDLTGLWEDDTGGGGVYRVRQIGNRLFWIVDGASKGSYVNLAFGEITGNVMTGKWVDLPGSPTLGGGDISLRIESNDRFVKVSSSPFYGAQAWTRQDSRSGATTGSPLPPPPPRGGGAAPISWSDAPSQLRGQNGTRVTYSCPGTATPQSVRGIYGTDVYTDDSGICTAAVHAGFISFASGGTVTIEVRPGHDLYVESTRNGVRSSAYRRWPGSFAVITAGAITGLAQRVAAPDPIAETRVWRYESSGGWVGTWTRRGNSDLYDSEIRGPNGEHVTIVERVTFDGNRVRAQRIQSSDGHLCTVDGTLHDDGHTYQGLGQCPGWFSGWAWRIYPQGRTPYPW